MKTNGKTKAGILIIVVVLVFAALAVGIGIKLSQPQRIEVEEPVDGDAENLGLAEPVHEIPHTAGKVEDFFHGASCESDGKEMT